MRESNSASRDEQRADRRTPHLSPQTDWIHPAPTSRRNRERSARSVMFSASSE
jgi:hypothetical protein